MEITYNGALRNVLLSAYSPSASLLADTGLWHLATVAIVGVEDPKFEGSPSGQSCFLSFHRAFVKRAWLIESAPCKVQLVFNTQSHLQSDSLLVRTKRLKRNVLKAWSEGAGRHLANNVVFEEEEIRLTRPNH